MKPRTVFAGFLFLLMVANLAGFYVYFLFRLEVIHEESRAALFKNTAESFERFDLTRQAYENALVEENEVRLNDRMYDVAKMEFTGDRVILYARHDAAEDDLLLFIQEVIHNASSDDKPAPGTFTSFLSLTFLKSEPLQFEMACIGHYTHHTLYSFYDGAIHPSGVTPPPEI
ncbi:MAG: hypothetical protein FJZ78_08385 [Bacteroidetes bacterium]|nr:hypothetical protein [Bacteroidota bacterium]